MVDKILECSEELRYYYHLYQILHFNFQEKWPSEFFAFIEERLDGVNQAFSTVFKTFLKYKAYITNALNLPYSNAKLEATNKIS